MFSLHASQALVYENEELGNLKFSRWVNASVSTFNPHPTGLCSQCQEEGGEFTESFLPKAELTFGFHSRLPFTSVCLVG